MGVTVTNLLQGPAELYIGAVGALELLTANQAIDPLVWISLGGTNDGLEIQVSLDIADLTADQIVDAAGGAIQGRETTAKTTLAEPTLDNLARVLNEPLPAAAAAGSRFFEPRADLTAFDLTYAALLFVGRAPGGFKRAVTLRRVLSSDGTTTAQKKDAQQGLEVTWKPYYVSSTVKPFKYLDAVA